MNQKGKYTKIKNISNSSQCCFVSWYTSIEHDDVHSNSIEFQRLSRIQLHFRYIFSACLTEDWIVNTFRELNQCQPPIRTSFNYFYIYLNLENESSPLVVYTIAFIWLIRICFYLGKKIRKEFRWLLFYQIFRYTFIFIC